MSRLKFVIVGGARPNFVKIAPILAACNKYKSEIKVIFGSYWTTLQL